MFNKIGAGDNSILLVLLLVIAGLFVWVYVSDCSSITGVQG